MASFGFDIHCLFTEEGWIEEGMKTGEWVAGLARCFGGTWQWCLVDRES